MVCRLALPKAAFRRTRRLLLVTAGLLAAAAAGPTDSRAFDARDSLRNLRSGADWVADVRLRSEIPLPAPAFAGYASLRLPSGAPAPPPEASLLGWVPSLVLAGAFATAQFAFDPPRDSRWTDRNGFDSGIRRGLRGGSRDARDGAAVASDVLFAGLGVGLAGDWWWLRREYGLLRSVQVDTRWFLATNLTTRVAKVSAGRQRPYVQPCDRDDDWVSSCGGGRDGNAGFFSGHASNAAALAGLLCARHLNRADPGMGDAFVCGGASAAALTSGILRIVSEHHFATDVIAGWAVGAIFGYLLPSHFDYREQDGAANALRSFAPVVGPEYYGFQYGFRF